MFIGRTDVEAPMLWPPDVKSQFIGKDSDAGQDWGQEERETGGWDGWMASPTQWTWVWVDFSSWWWIGRPRVLRFMGLQRVGHDWVTELNWTDLQCLVSKQDIFVSCYGLWLIYLFVHFIFLALWVYDCHFLLAYKVSAKRFVHSLMMASLYIANCFSLAAFKILSLFFIFSSLILMLLSVSLLDYFYWELSGLPGSGVCFFPLVREVFSHYFFV